MSTAASPGTGRDRTRLAELLRRERAAFAAGHPRSADAYGRGRGKILFCSHCYHGSVDESMIVATPDGAGAPRPGNVGAPVDVTVTSRVAEFNDLAGLERELGHGDVAAVLMEPALTNIGIVLPEAGYLAGVRELTRQYGTLLINDETHTFCAGPGGATAAWGLSPDLVTIGKAIGGGIPAAAYGMSEELADRLLARPELDLIDVGGVGGTLAGNALSITAVCATLSQVLTDEAFGEMITLAERFTDGVAGVIARYGLPWSGTRLGARAEYRFTSPAPRTGSEAAAADDPQLDDYLHTFMANRGVLLDTTGKACPSGTGLPRPGAKLPSSPLAYNPATLQTSGLPSNMCILKGFPTALKSATSFPFGLWFANPDTLYVADEGNGDNTYSSATGTYTTAAGQTTARLQKWVLSGGAWKLAYTLQTGLDLGTPYTVPGYPAGDNPATGLPWAPGTDGLRNITGRVNPDGSVTIWAVTSTVSGGGDQGADPNKLVAITDRAGAAAPSAGEAFHLVKAAGVGQVLRGVSVTPGT
jgi:Aminotransferase class-III